MIGQSPRIVLIDDKLHHLSGLAQALGKLDSACLPFHFQDAGPTERQLRNARVIFCDLHLLSDALTADTKQQLAVIAGMLSDGLKANHGPYVLIIWTEFPDKVDGLQEYLQALEPGQRPIEYICLDKNNFIDPKNGDLIAEGSLIAEIQNSLGKWSGVTALLWWESAVADAAADLATDLWEPSGDDDSARPEGLRQTFGKLAVGSAGDETARKHPGMAVNEALVPMLSDRIERTKFPQEIWDSAVEFDNQNQAVPTARLNTLVHLDFIHGLSPLQRGSASPLLATWSKEQWFIDKFGYSQEEVLKAFGFQGDRLVDAKNAACWLLIQIRAACDEAQGKAGLLPFVLAAQISTEPKKSRSPSAWASRDFQFGDKVVRIYAHSNFVLGLSASEASGFKPTFRLRSSLLESLVVAVHSHASRPGTIDIC
ncbi:MAG: hypothetical protein WAT93_00305 [Pontixanthobacter sp.]